jgi:hypothetical protein
MTNLLYFSGYIKPVAKKIRFLLIVCGRFFIILFRWRKDVKLLHLEYARKYQFDNSYLIIRYRFRNALWYNFKNIKKRTEEQIIILNLKNVPEIPIELTAYGFFRSKTFHISVIPENTLQNNSFKTSIKGFNDIEIYSKPFILKDIKLTPTLPKINLYHSEIQIKYPLYTQTDFI